MYLFCPLITIVNEQVDHSMPTPGEELQDILTRFKYYREFVTQLTFTLHESKHIAK